jgi:hypothetical protein
VTAVLENLTPELNLTSGDVYGTFLSGSTAAPRLDIAGPLVGGQFPLLLTGTPGIRYAIEMKTNFGLAGWTVLVTNSLDTGMYSFIDVHATNTGRFYRAVKQ